MYPMQWVEVDNNAQQRRSTDNTTVQPKYKSRKVGCGNFATEGVLIHLHPTWTRIASCAVGVHKLTSPSMLVTSGWRLTVFCCTVYPLAVCQKKESQKELFGLLVFPSMAPRMRDEDLCFRLKGTCQASGFSQNQILPTLCTLRSDESEIIAVVAANVDDLLYGYFPEGEEGMNSKLRQLLVDQERMWYFQFLWQ